MASYSDSEDYQPHTEDWQSAKDKVRKETDTATYVRDYIESDFAMFHGCNSIADAATKAKQLTADKGELWIPYDLGRWTSPRYGAIRMFQLGEDVSQSFNGDSYPAGQIVKISASLRKIETSTGLVFWRQRESSTWLNRGTWTLVRGHRNERNPSF